MKIQSIISVFRNIRPYFSKVSIPIISASILGLSCFAQTAPTKVAFTTPEVTAFNRSIETPVSLYTGVPNISIPLYEINIKGVSVPIKLDYHAGGIRVDQEATWVGLGWNLSYGGEISRKIRGIADEYQYLNGSPNSSNTVNYFMNLPNIGQTTSQDIQLRLEKVQNAKYNKGDLMPDEFYYSVLGYSGRFMFSQPQNKFLLFPKEDIDVKKYSKPFADADLYLWNLRLPNGVSVNFGDNAYTSSPKETFGVEQNVRNSWQIRTIKNNLQDSIVYDYENFNYSLLKLSGSYYKVDTKSGHSFGTNSSYVQMYDSRVKKISFPGGRIDFITTSREDMPTEALSQIKVYDNNNNLIKSIQFNYSYFFGNSFDVLSVLNLVDNRTTDNYKYKRLKLESIDIAANGNEPIKYTFDYYTSEQMPSKYSFSQDHYGFYNGIDNTRQNGFIPTLTNFYTGGDRRVKPEASKIFSLKSVTYPEKGKTEFIYEGNSAGIMNIPGELLANYQDDNFIEKYAAISVSSYSRNTSYPAPDQISNGVRYFRKQFTIGGEGYTSFSKNWSIGTNFGISSLETPLPFSANNVEFKLERINPDNSRVVVRRFNTTDINYNGSGSTPRNGFDEQMIGLSGGNYEMTVAITYANQPNTPADNQPYNLSFFIKWREMDPQKKSVSVGGLRIKDINYFNHGNTLIKKKSYTYINPNVIASIPNYTSGQTISFPQYFEYKVRKIDGGGVRPDEHAWIQYFSSNSVLPLETTSGSAAGYEYVDELDVNIEDNTQAIKSRSHFSFDRPYFSQFYKNKIKGLIESNDWNRGKLLDREYYKGSQLIKKEQFEYNYKSPHLLNLEDEDYVEEVNTDLISFQSLNYACQCSVDFPEDFYDTDGYFDNCVYYYYSAYNNFAISSAGAPDFNGNISNQSCYSLTVVPYFKQYTGFDKLKSKTTTTYDDLQTPVIQKEDYIYGNTPIHYQLTKQEIQNSKGSIVQNHNKYPQDIILSGDEEIGRQALIAQHQIDVKLKQISEVDGKEDISQTDFYFNSPINTVTPRSTKTNSGPNGILEVRSEFTKFDNKGNLLELSFKSGPKTVYVWSYNKLYPIAEIKNAEYSTVESLLGGSGAIEIFSNSNPTDAQVNSFLAPLRSALPNALVTTYTYKPLIGMTSSTDAKGMT
ncbi:MAG: hypothetical protein J7577_18380, partial [Sphingobacteriaceae bacterium]|nr:hypothetical protein [Sphingobacteriaceae bacterium]